MGLEFVAIGLLKPVLISVVSGVGLGAVNAFKKMARKENTEKFDKAKLRDTAVVSLVVGVVAYAQGYTLTGDNYEAYVAANAGVIALAQSSFQAVGRWIKGRG